MKIEFQYFKSSGKYYSSGEIEEPTLQHFHEAIPYAKNLLNTGKRPGLIDGFDFNVLITAHIPEVGPCQFLLVRGTNIIGQM